ncbi:hypothetical protein M5X00_31200 [Paenibacillus alvei]|uniref:Transglycosylase n=1 Tax=Paenibacillus alvei TaxID=44250 RepID=A0ABT4H7N9_PAEAL|nr:hypothetical protein [Paenibacillus alvei]MCY9704185.1 hypothetical protein [Paenibacillus alvei]MCY9737998.1 hypothetical protein [Paenibacillus alvei]MCY9758688.1 hypothetical protein [Paenibacillus alvei]MCY9765002.1 hypothetical protein [Paenibacillus alvei]MCY9771301.1 hypothetical protein [Paenibacillus alvei]
MNGITATCDAGCGEQFIATDFKQADMGNGIEKIYLTCTHCGKEYVAFYSDDEVKKLQQKVRNIQRQFANPSADHRAVERMEAKEQAKIKARMDELRERIEGEA